MKNRVELHCHTKMSQMEGLADVRELIRKAKKMGMPAIAITDRDSVQAFPEAYEAFIRLTAEMESSENYTAKVLYGLEAYVVDDSLYLTPNKVIVTPSDPHASLNNVDGGDIYVNIL